MQCNNTTKRFNRLYPFNRDSNAIIQLKGLTICILSTGMQCNNTTKRFNRLYPFNSDSNAIIQLKGLPFVSFQ